MAATNFILAVYQKLFTLLEAHAPTAGKLKAGNEVREDRGKLYPRTLGAMKDTDFPRIYLKVGATLGGWSADDRTFQTMEAGFDPSQGGWLENITQNFEMKIVHNALDLSANSLFELEAFTAIRKGGPSLGKSYVIGWSYNAQREETAKGLAAGTLRQITTVTIPVQMQFEGVELVT